MNFGLQQHIIDTIIVVFEQYLYIEKAFVFGRAKENHQANSDIDIAIKGYNLNKDDISAISHALASQLTTHKINLTSYNNIQENKLINQIENEGIEIYRRWKEIPLSKTTKFIVDNRGKTVPTEKNGIPLIATNCINNTNLYPTYDNLRYISQETYDNWFRSHPEPGDIILTLKGSQNGAVCLVPNPVDFVIAQDMVALRANDDIIDPHFLFAALRSSEVQHEIKNLDVSGVIPHLKKSDFDKLMIPFPDMDTQQIIGSIYFSLSNKINLLQQQNKTLEQLAETLFRQWFVEEAEESKTLGELAKVSTGKGLQRSEFIENGIYPILGANGEIGKTNNYLTEENLILTGRVGTLGEVKISNGKVWVSDNVLMICPNEKKYFYPIYFSLLRIDFENMNVGSTQPLITQTDFKKIALTLANEDKLITFQNDCNLYFDKINKNKQQIHTLIETRDTLLPKLMSGEIAINASCND